MAGRSLSPEENTIWEKVTATVRQMEGKQALRPLSLPTLRATAPRPTEAPAPRRQAPPGEHLDGGWDRRLRKGVVMPERTVDLHGHSVTSAHGVLDHAIERAVLDHVRVLLIITGKPPRDPAPHQRGLIRAAIGDWLASSRHAGHIAAVRNAHPRHGGAGALYVIMRRARSG